MGDRDGVTHGAQVVRHDAGKGRRPAEDGRRRGYNECLSARHFNSRRTPLHLQDAAVRSVVPLSPPPFPPAATLSSARAEPPDPTVSSGGFVRLRAIFFFCFRLCRLYRLFEFPFESLELASNQVP